MRTTLDIDEGLLQQVVVLTGERNKARAVNAALTRYIRQERIRELRAMAGTVELVDNLDELENLEIQEMQRRW